MNSTVLYQWTGELDKRFPHLGRWQVVGLALFSYGVGLAQSCILSQVGQHLTGKRVATSMERRLQRWLANARIEMKSVFPAWISWFMSYWGRAPLLVLVDETKLGDHVAVMMVSLYYRGSAIPMIWRAYLPSAYPVEGQVALIGELLAQLGAALPQAVEAVLLADRGLGTSPRWQQILTEQGWDYLLRVQGSTRLRRADGTTPSLGRLVGYGQQWFGYGEIFKKAGWQRRTVFVIWAVGYKEPWCLVSNRRDLSPALYAWRFSQEAGFRDLKSDGFDWQCSRVWLPEHVERLLLVLTLATFWTLATGTIVLHTYPLTQRDRRLSVFRLGRDELFVRLRTFKQGCLEFYFAPDTPALKVS